MAITKIQSGAIPPEAIDTTHIGDVGADKITGQVVTSQISDGAIHTDKVADLAVTHAKLHTDMDLSGKTVTLPTLNQSLTLDGPDGGVAKLRLQAEEVHGDIEGINIGNNFGGLAFKTNNNGTVAERVRIDNAGNVGIGTDSPVRKLHVLSDTVGDIAAFEGTNNGIVIQGHSSDANIVEIVGYKQSDATYADVHIRSNAAGLIVKEDTGNVGIGTTTPDTKLHVSAGTGVDSGIRIQNGASQRGNIFYDGVQALVIHGASAPGGGDATTNPTLHFATGGTTPVNRMSITRDGNVGIGITNPGTPLHIDNGNVDGTILRLTNEEIGLNITVDGGTGNYSGSARTVTLNATRFDGGSEPALRLAGQDRIDFATDANSVKASLYKNTGFNNASQLNLHNTYLRRSTEKITEWTAFTHCSTPDNANFLHIRTPIITHPSGSYGAYQPVAMEIYGYHNYEAENFHDCTVVVNTTASGLFQSNLRANNNNHSSLTVYRSSSTYNGYNRVCFSVPKNGCCCVGAIWVRFRWWNGLPTDNYAWGHTGTYSTSDGF